MPTVYEIFIILQILTTEEKSAFYEAAFFFRSSDTRVFLVTAPQSFKFLLFMILIIGIYIHIF